MVKKDSDADARLRHKMSVPKVYDLMHSVHVKKRRDEIIDQLNNCGFGGMLHICNWTRIHTFFIDWVVRRFEKEHMWIRLSDTEVLELKEDDVHRVYELPMAGKKIDTNLCSDGAIRRLRKELGLTGDYSPVVKVAELERILKTTEKPKTWVKGIICFIIHNILCPTNKGNVSLQYADILEDPAGVSSYNWCSHVLDYMKKGLQSPGVLNPLADFHFLMINYMDKMGKRSPFLTGKYKRPSLRDWDVKAANQELAKIHDIMGLENGLTAGVTSLYRPAEGPLVLCFDADTCPLSKIMTPAIAGNPGSHYVCFVVNFKSHKFEFLNSLTGGGEKLQLPNGEPSLYKQMFDVWLNEVEAFVTELYKLWKIKMPFQFTTFNWDTPKVPTQVDSDNCGVFCMKFLDEWGGEMQSFKGWSKLRKHGDNGKIAKIMDLRIDLCSAILTNSSNSRKEQVLKDAT
ncbi:unnamed protein product [Trifolium pratense]|uniref:Uncharacterized protein n=1 Tax=Trifolium pratense TaxID=57577 RepID=A0ACB0JL96_TRIPR|nr:unnamed protein product [Trifolium pratense]